METGKKIYDVFDAVNSSNRNNIAMILKCNDGSEKTCSYGEMFEQIDIMANKLCSIGIKPGMRTVIVAQSSPVWNIAYLACLKLKSATVLVDASLDTADIVKLIKKSDAACMMTTDKLFEELASTFDADMMEIPVLDIEHNGELFSGSALTVKQPSIVIDEAIASIIFSSGTTKAAAGIIHSHDSILGSAKICLDNNGIFGKNQRFLGILPNSHIYGLYTQVIAPMTIGATVCFVQSLNAPVLLSAFADFKPTVFPAVPKVFELLRSQIVKKIENNAKTKFVFRMLFPVCLKVREKTGINLGKLIFGSIHRGFGGKMSIMSSAGAPIDKKTVEFYYGVGFNLLITYGATETSIPTIGNYGKTLTTDSCGKPYPGIETKISSNGELLMKSPFLMLGYFNDPETTKESFDQEGWFKTGDLAEFDLKGNLHIKGRCKENIVLSNGKKIAPDDIETAYLGIEGVEELIICGVPFETGGYDEVHAFVVAEEKNRDNVRDKIKDRSKAVNLNMKLSGIHFMDEIPKTSLQKPKRFLLKQMVQEEKAESIERKSDTPDDKSDCTNSSLPVFIKKIISEIANIPIDEVHMNSLLFEELGIDSLGGIELAIAIENFNGRQVDSELRKNLTVEQLIKIASSTELKKVQKNDSGKYPKRKGKSEYRAFNFYRNLVRVIYNVKVKNDNMLPEDSGYILCANHVTNFDYLFLTSTFSMKRFSNFCCLAKKELFNNNPLNMKIIKIGGLIPIDRTGVASFDMALAKEKLKEKWGILIHPEGTRSKDGKLGMFKQGAAKLSIDSDSPIVPAYIHGGYEIYPSHKILPKLYDWKKRKRYSLEVIYGTPIFPSGLSVEELTNKVNEEITKLGLAKQEKICLASTSI